MTVAKVVATLCLLLSSLQADRFFGYGLFDGHGAVMLLIDPASGQIVDANRAAVAFYGYPRDQIHTMTIQQINTLSPQQVEAERQLAAAQSRNYFRFRHRTAAGSVHDVEVFSWPVRAGDRELLFSIVQDVTDRQVAQEAVLHYSRQLEGLVDIRTEALLAQEKLFRTLLWAAILLQTLVIAWLAYNIYRRKRAEAALKETLHDQARTIEEAIRQSQMQAEVIADQQRRQALAELLVNLAHQWRQPLNAAGLLIQEIEEGYIAGDLNQELMRRHTARAFGQLKSLSDTLDRFTELYEDRSDPQCLPLLPLCQEAADLMALRLTAQQTTLTLDVNPDHMACVARRDLIEVVIKLINNAAEAATNRLKEALTIHISSQQTEEMITLTIEDNAGGINPELIGRLFEPYQTDNFKGRNKGLSLYLIQQLIEGRYNGTVRVENKEEGAAVQIALPNRC